MHLDTVHPKQHDNVGISNKGAGRAPFPAHGEMVFAEWNSAACALCGAFFWRGLTHYWICPSRYRIADHALGRGSIQVAGRKIDFFGTMIQSVGDMGEVNSPRVQLNESSSFAICRSYHYIPSGGISWKRNSLFRPRAFMRMPFRDVENPCPWSFAPVLILPR